MAKTTKKPVTGKTNKTASAKKPAPKKTVPAKKTATKEKTDRRPASNPAVPPLKVGQLLEDIGKIKTDLEEYAAHLRALDRRRLNGNRQCA